RVVFHRRECGRGAGHEPAHHAVADLAGPQRALDPGGEVDDLALALGLQPQQRGVDRHQAAATRRKKPRLPTWRTRPARSSVAKSSSEIGTLSRRTPPWPTVRRTSERDMP